MLESRITCDHTDKAGCEILHVIMLRDSGVVAPFDLWCIVTRVPIRLSHCNWYYTGFWLFGKTKQIGFAHHGSQISPTSRDTNEHR